MAIQPLREITQLQVEITPPLRVFAQPQVAIIPLHWDIAQLQVEVTRPLREDIQPQVVFIPPHRDIAQRQVVIFPSHRDAPQLQVVIITQVFTTDFATILETLLVLLTQTSELFLMETRTILREERGGEQNGQSLQHPQIRDVIRLSVTDFRIVRVVVIRLSEMDFRIARVLVIQAF